MNWFSTLAANQIRDKADYFGAQRRSVSKETPLDTLGGPEDESSPALQLRGSDPTPSQIYAVNEEARLIEEALDLLPQDYRETIILRDFDGLDFKEIGQKSNRSPDAARMLYNRAVLQLTKEVEKNMV